jgi:hypothetical protein
MARTRSSIGVRALTVLLAVMVGTLGAGASSAAAAKGAEKSVARAPIPPPAGPARPLGPPLAAPPAASPSIAARSASSLAVCATTALDLRVLVVSADGREPSLAAIKRALNGLGVPFTVWIAKNQPGQLTPDRLSSDCNGLYQAVLLTNGSLGYSDNGKWVLSALSAAEWQTLRAYEASFGVRQVNWYTYPSPATGFDWPLLSIDTTVTAHPMQLTTQGRTVFPYVRPDAWIPIQGAWTYLARPLVDGLTTPLLTDADGYALAGIRSTPDGREELSMTFDANPFLLHEAVLWYGLVNWATRGLFVGERHAYFALTVDDFFSGGGIWPADRACGSSTDTGQSYRTSAADLSALIDWQKAKRADVLSRQFVLSFAFIGSGSVQGAYVPDTLTPAARQNAGQFRWINHTYSHPDLTSVDYNTARAQITQNTTVAAQLGLRSYSRANLVTPALSGLRNPAVLQAAFDTGVRYVVATPTRPSWDDPLPNTATSLEGTFQNHSYSLLSIPRRETNLYYNVSTPDQWLAEDHCLYPAGQWGHAATYDQLLARESDVMLRYLLSGDVNPVGFHMLNVRAYDGRRSLLGDLVDLTLQAYGRLVNVPLLNPSMLETGQRVNSRMQFDRARYQLVARLVTSESGRVLQVSSPVAATVPVTGLRSGNNETYAGQPITYLNIAREGSVSVPVN